MLIRIGNQVLNTDHISAIAINETSKGRIWLTLHYVSGTNTIVSGSEAGILMEWINDNVVSLGEEG